MTTRVLPPEEWDRLGGTDTASILPFVDGRNMRVIVAENESGAIVGACVVLTVTHIEGLWLDEGQTSRRLSTLRALVRTVWRTLHREGIRWVMMSLVSDQMKQRLIRSGARQVQGETFLLAQEYALWRRLQH